MDYKDEMIDRYAAKFGSSMAEITLARNSLAITLKHHKEDMNPVVRRRLEELVDSLELHLLENDRVPSIV